MSHETLLRALEQAVRGASPLPAPLGPPTTEHVDVWPEWVIVAREAIASEKTMPVRCRKVMDVIGIESVLRQEVIATREKFPVGGPECEARLAALKCVARSFALLLALELAPDFTRDYRAKFERAISG